MSGRSPQSDDAGRRRARGSEMLARVRLARPDASDASFLLQAMVRRIGARELIAGLSDDPTFGPVVLFGRGGVGVEVYRDTALGCPRSISRSPPISSTRPKSAGRSRPIATSRRPTAQPLRPCSSRLARSPRPCLRCAPSI